MNRQKKIIHINKKTTKILGETKNLKENILDKISKKISQKQEPPKNMLEK